MHRDLEKACSDMYSYFEQARESASSMVAWTNDLVAASGQDPAIRKVNLRFRNLNQVNESMIHDQIVLVSNCNSCIASAIGGKHLLQDGGTPRSLVFSPQTG